MQRRSLTSASARLLQLHVKPDLGKIVKNEEEKKKVLFSESPNLYCLSVAVRFRSHMLSSIVISRLLGRTEQCGVAYVSTIL